MALFRFWCTQIALSCLLLLLAGCDNQSDLESPPTQSPSKPAAALSAPLYVGKDACTTCHQQETQDWQGSHHDLAMQVASESSILGDFNQAKFVYNGIETTFYRQQDAFMVRTDGPDGLMKDYPIKYAFGVAPLQQYLIELEGGRIQALGIAWDSRPVEQGGQRWFHLYPSQQVDYRSHLHWTKPDQNWNYMCAECHSTRLEKNYDPQTNTFATRFSEINVTCEACHGPGSNHVVWAKAGASSANRADSRKGLRIIFDERKGVLWNVDAHSGKVQRSKARLSRKEIDTCARCHSRRSILSEAFEHGRPIGDTHRVALLDETLYFPDGQPADENYVYGSFLQSKMYHKGVTCSDCHQPHSLALKLPGDQVCGQCHALDRYASTQHHFHSPASAGARCAECHMPVTTFMVVDGRHDHSFRIPRPDVSETLGTPNVCTGCHTGHDAQWAAAEMKKWYGHPSVGFQDYAQLLADARLGNPAVSRSLLAFIQNEDQPAIARATAIELSSPFPSSERDSVLTVMSQHRDPLLRRATIAPLSSGSSSIGSQVLASMLNDDVKDVRVSAARALIALRALGASDTANPEVLKRVLDEYIATQELNADRAESWLNLGSLYVDQGALEAAELAYKSALKLDADFVPAIINLADLYRMTQRDSLAEAILVEGLQRQPKTAALSYSLGLLRVRRQDYPAALVALARAYELEQENARYAFVYGVALHDAGDRPSALEVLQKALIRHPFDRDLQNALSAYRLSK